jgi:hypothetical protein
MKNIFLIIATFFFFCSSDAAAQDTQYWTKQYGTYGELLGGTVVGAISDLSATYYNPGSLPFIKDTVLILTTHSLQAYMISLENAFGSNQKLQASSVTGSPGIFAVRLPLKWLGNNQVIISYITRYNFTFEAEGLNATPYSQNKNNYLSEEILTLQNLSEYWAGISWSNEISKNIGFGATIYFPYRSQSVRNQAIGQLRDSTNRNKTAVLFENYSYYNLRCLVKFGATFDLSPLMLGITITTPSVNLFGNGSASLNITNTGFNLDSPELNEVFASNYQENLSTKFNSAFSIALGTAYYMKNTSFYLTFEWFNDVKEFNIMSPSLFYAQSNGKKVNYNATYSLKSVINMGLGIKYIVNPDFIFYGSVTSDQSSYVPNSKNRFAISNWDIIHLRTGGMFTFKNMNITLGLGYGFSGNFYNRLNILDWNKKNESNVVYNQLDAIFGFSYKL